ncbi:hypothetical protein LCGC14_1128640 [marine sediment metagenome]|uniref:Uncharacterized protein n=1 Tax=marine sediment metagenome TaxID=412755 RepID=A0A0F9Q7L0_9ZZZZ
MKFGSIQITKRMKEGECDHCEKALELGTPYVTITIRAKAKSGKHWFHNWHLHLACIGVWLLSQLVARQDRRKKAGRPKGTGMGLSPEDKKKRLAFCKRRMRILQEVSTCPPKDRRLGEWFTKFAEVNEMIDNLGGAATINHRTILDVAAVTRKLEYGKALNEQSRLDFSKVGGS